MCVRAHLYVHDNDNTHTLEPVCNIWDFSTVWAEQGEPDCSTRETASAATSDYQRD